MENKKALQPKRLILIDEVVCRMGPLWNEESQHGLGEHATRLTDYSNTSFTIFNNIIFE